MMRVVAFPKAAIAGLAGAAVMEGYSLLGSKVGLSSIDFVQQLSSSAFVNSPVLANAIAIAVHLSIGVCWAVFYAFFFWGRTRLRPILQGLAFAIIPASLAILVVYP